ncbi:MAG: helicase-related protein, partial [Chloroflexota bacterium]
RSFERRLARIDSLIEDVRSGKITLSRFNDEAEKTAGSGDPFDTLAADDEEAGGEEEASEQGEDALLGGFEALTIADLEEERRHVERLLKLANQVRERGQESKFDRLRERLGNPEHRDEKLIIFTEHRDTLIYLRQRLEGLGFTGQIAMVHGGLDYKQREEQVALFRKPAEDGGADYLLATDAAGEGINLQFCWQMINYDVPWNPARLEQRMGRIHRYGQKHDPVLIVNLVADETREGTVMATLLRKLETIRGDIGSDKVFDVIGRLFKNVSLRDYMQRAAVGDSDVVGRELEGSLTKEQVEALEQREKALFGGGGVRAELPRLRLDLERERLRALLPGYMRRFIGRAAPVLDLNLTGDLDSTFQLQAVSPGALDALLPILELYTEQQRSRLTITRSARPDSALFLHPGEPLFERLRTLIG